MDLKITSYGQKVDWNRMNDHFEQARSMRVSGIRHEFCSHNVNITLDENSEKHDIILKINKFFSYIQKSVKCRPVYVIWTVDNNQGGCDLRMGMCFKRDVDLSITRDSLIKAGFSGSVF